jgi:hypothetical protein
MSLLNHATNILTKPKMEWEVIKNETVTPVQLFTGYVAILALIPAIASFIGLCFIGITVPGFIGISSFTFKYSIVEGLIQAVTSYVMSFIGVYAGAFIINALATNFESTPDMGKALKLVVFSYTPVWLSGIFAIYPTIAVLGIVGLYGLYLLYIGLEPMMNTPQPKKMVYFIVSILVLIVVYFLIGIVIKLATPQPSLNSLMNQMQYNF